MFLRSFLHGTNLFLSRFTHPSQSHPAMASLRDRLISSASCLQSVRSSFPDVLSGHTGHFRQTARRTKSVFSSQSILRGLHCKAKEVLKEDTNRLISLQLVNDHRKLKTVYLKITEELMCYRHPPRSHHSNQNSQNVCICSVQHRCLKILTSVSVTHHSAIG